MTVAPEPYVFANPCPPSMRGVRISELSSVDIRLMMMRMILMIMTMRMIKMTWILWMMIICLLWIIFVFFKGKAYHFLSFLVSIFLIDGLLHFFYEVLFQFCRISNTDGIPMLYWPL